MEKYSLNKYSEWHRKGLLRNRNCPVCRSDKGIPILDKRLKDGCRFDKCVSCGLVYANPVPTEEQYNEIYITSYGGLSARWVKEKEKCGLGDEVISDANPVLKWLKKRKKTGVLLDYGCGSGGFLNKAQDYYDVYGVDADDFAIRKARECLNDHGGDKVINFRELKDEAFYNKFDIVHCNQNLEHLLEPIAYLEKFYKWLKPGGIIYISVPASDSFAFSFLKTANSMASLGHVSLFDKRSIKEALKRTGFEDVEIKHKYIDVTATEFWKKMFNIEFIHRHSFISSKFIVFTLYPFMFVTTAFLNILGFFGIIKGNYIEVFAKKPVL